MAPAKGTDPRHRLAMIVLHCTKIKLTQTQRRFFIQ